MSSLPFEIASNQGHEISGLAFLEEEFVVFQIQVKKWSVFKQPLETVKVEPAVFTSIRFERGIFSDSIYLVPKRSDLLEAIPGDHKGELRLKIAKRYRNEAERFISETLRKARERKAV